MKRRNKSKATRKKEELLGLLLIILGVLILLSLVSYHVTDWPNSSSRERVANWLGLAGAWLAFYLFNYTIGYPALVLPFLLILWGWTIVTRGFVISLLRHTGYALFFALCFSVAFALPRTISPETVSVNYEFNGHVGAFIAFLLYRYLGAIGGVLVLFAAMLIAFISMTNISLAGFFDLINNVLQRFRQGIASWKEAKERHRALKQKLREQKLAHFQAPEVTSPPGKIVPSTSSKQEELSFEIAENEKEVEAEIVSVSKSPEISSEKLTFSLDEETGEPGSFDATSEGQVVSVPADYRLPPIDLLDEFVTIDWERRQEELMQEARTLEQKLALYGVQGKVVQIHPGPVITRFEVEPAPGVKISKFQNIADDLALVLKAKQIRIIAPIPGKAAVGIEIPNPQPSLVPFRNVIESTEFQQATSRLTLGLGVDTTGQVYVTDLTAMPHLLVAGSTGSGKSVCLNAIIASLLFKHTPEEVRFILIDPKKLELSIYAKLRRHHLITLSGLNEDVITTPENAISILRRLGFEMERRYKILSKANVRILEDYNAWVEEQPPNVVAEKNLQKLPYIIVIIDELADLMMVADREIEEPIGRLAHLSRAVGIHLIVATQRPSTDVITGAIKANFPCRIAFQVASKTDSRVVLDINGAERLLGKGDMLFQPPREPLPIRLHSAYVSTQEIARIVDYVAAQPAFPPLELPFEKEAEISEQVGQLAGQRDELFNEALKLVVRHNQGSISLLQRRLRIGYARAARLIDQMEQAGFVGVFDGSKAREVLVTEEDLEEMGII